MRKDYFYGNRYTFSLHPFSNIATNIAAESFLTVDGFFPCSLNGKCASLTGFDGAAIIEDIRASCINDPYIALAYVYLDAIVGHELDAALMLRTLIKQLIYQKRTLPKGLVDLYTRYNVADYETPRRGGSGDVMSNKTPLEALEIVPRRIIDEMGQIGLVFGALDECREIECLRQVLMVY